MPSSARRSRATRQPRPLCRTRSPREDSDLLQEITQNRLTQAVSARAEARASVANSEVQRLSISQLSVFEELTLLVKDDPLVWLQFASAAETAQNYETAITAYEEYLDLQPNSPQAKQIQERIDSLKVISGAVDAGRGSGRLRHRVGQRLRRRVERLRYSPANSWR